MSRLEAEKMQLYRDLQRCVYEIQQRDQYFHQLNTKVGNSPAPLEAIHSCQSNQSRDLLRDDLLLIHLHPSSSSLKLQQAVEEKAAVAGQLRAVSQTLRDSQNRCHWLESQIQGQVEPPQHLHPSLVSMLLVLHLDGGTKIKTNLFSFVCTFCPQTNWIFGDKT